MTSLWGSWQDNQKDKIDRSRCEADKTDFLPSRECLSQSNSDRLKGKLGRQVWEQEKSECSQNDTTETVNKRKSISVYWPSAIKNITKQDYSSSSVGLHGRYSLVTYFWVYETINGLLNGLNKWIVYFSFQV